MDHNIHAIFSLFLFIRHSIYCGPPSMSVYLGIFMSTSISFWMTVVSSYIDTSFFFNWRLITLQYCIGFCHTLTWIRYGCTCVPHPEPPPTSLPITSLWVIPVHQPQASCILHWTWTGDSFHIWYYTCFNAILPNHPTLSLSHRVQKTVLYICIFFAILHTGLSLLSF